MRFTMHVEWFVRSASNPYITPVCLFVCLCVCLYVCFFVCEASLPRCAFQDHDACFVCLLFVCLFVFVVLCACLFACLSLSKKKTIT